MGSDKIIDADVQELESPKEQGIVERPSVMPVFESLKKTRDSIRDTLEKADRSILQRNSNATKLTAIWDEINAFADTNEMIRLNMQQMQIHFQLVQPPKKQTGPRGVML